MHRHDLHQRPHSNAHSAGNGGRIITVSVGIIGAGKVGGTLARLWFERGYRISAVYSRSPERAAALAERVGAQVVPAAADVVDYADLTVIAVPDDVIETVAAALAIADWTGKAAVHTAGSRDSAALAVLQSRGGLVGTLHPAFPFADVETAVQKLPGAAFALEADDPRLYGWLTDLVAALDGHPIRIPPGQKALYHAALVIASNYAVTLYAAAEALLLRLGAGREQADTALNALVAGTVENLRTKGIPDALTGPLTRADVTTIGSHLRALADDPALAEIYVALARQTYPLLEARGLSTDRIEMLLRGYHASEHP
ncbi:MAG: DUF2520 domain-containing protein [Chloroflexi bacterium]|nr:DUF2520 domain-containing protein [Chloroflexota bacterium]